MSNILAKVSVQEQVFTRHFTAGATTPKADQVKTMSPSATGVVWPREGYTWKIPHLKGMSKITPAGNHA